MTGTAGSPTKAPKLCVCGHPYVSHGEGGCYFRVHEDPVPLSHQLCDCDRYTPEYRVKPLGEVLGREPE